MELMQNPDRANICSVVGEDADLIVSVLENAEVVIEENAVFTGSLLHLNAMKERLEERSMRIAQELRADPALAFHFTANDLRAYTGLYDFGHTAPDWKNIYRLGLCGLMERLENSAIEAVTPQQKQYCAAGARVWQAAISYIARMAKKAEEMGKKRMADGLYALTHRPPQSLYEAMQLCFLYYDLQQHVEQTFVRTLGRLDQLFYPFVENDLKTGALTEQEVIELTDAFLYAWNERNVTSNIPFSLCGSDLNGKILNNSYSYSILERHVALKLPNVKAHILYREEMPKELLEIAFSGIRDGGNSIVFLNDKRVCESLVKFGIEKEDAQQYEVVGCYEPSARGEVPCSCNGRINLARAVESALFGGCDLLSGTRVGLDAPKDFDNFEAFLEAFYLQLGAFCTGAMELVNAWERKCLQLHSAPFYSATFDACVRNMGDAYCDHGAKYNNSSVNLVGLATAVDYLLAIKKLVFEDRQIELGELRHILKENWKGFEPLRRRILSSYPKYGIGNNDADRLAQEILAFASSRINGKPNAKNGIFRLGAFSIDWRRGFGRRMGASADGRRSGEPLSKNIGASLGADREGVTAQILSAASLNGDLMPNGSVLDIVLHSSAAKGREGLVALLGTLQTFMRLGGMAIQYSVLNAEVLREAQRSPEQYPNLQVRLCGWNVLFSSLSKNEQDEYILQSELRA